MKIYDYILEYESITTSKAEILLEVKERRARTILTEMCKQGYLKKIGATSNLKYVINDIKK